MEGPSEIQKLGAEVLRPEKRITDEDLVASELAAAVLGRPLDKIRHAVEAMFLLDEEERRRAGITEEEEREAERIYTLTLAFQNAHFYTPPGELECARISWPFSREEAEEWLSPWLGKPNLRFLVPEGGKLPPGAPLAQKVYVYCDHGITKDSYQGLVVRFARYGMPRAARLMRKIMRLISPGSYKQALQLLGGRRHGKA